jgi:hypothetical protein
MKTKIRFAEFTWESTGDRNLEAYIPEGYCLELAAHGSSSEANLSQERLGNTSTAPAHKLTRANFHKANVWVLNHGSKPRGCSIQPTTVLDKESVTAADWVGLTSSRHARGNLGKRIEDVEKAYREIGQVAANQGENDEFDLW